MVVHIDAEPKPDYPHAAFVERLHAAFDQINISPDESIIVGGQVLAAHGIRTATDLDILVGPQTFIALHDDAHTPAAVSAGFHKGERRPGVVSLSWDDQSGNGLRQSADVICQYDPSENIPVDEAQTAFGERIQNHTTTVGDLHFLTLADAVQQMHDKPHYKFTRGGDKTTRDFGLIRRYLEQRSAGSAPDALITPDTDALQEVSSLLRKGWSQKLARSVFRR